MHGGQIDGPVCPHTDQQRSGAVTLLRKKLGKAVLGIGAEGVGNPADISAACFHGDHLICARMKPELLIGILAASAGLLPKPEPISARELATIFSWDKIEGKEITVTDITALY